MRTNGVPVVLLLFGLAGGLGAQALTLASVAGDVDEERVSGQAAQFQLAQAQEVPGSQGPGADGQNDQGGRSRRGPPPQAIAACNGKTSGAPCTFTGHRNQARTGTCFAPPAAASNPSGSPAELPLACRPDRSGAGKGPAS